MIRRRKTKVFVPPPHPQPWIAHGLTCPTRNPLHQPYPTPWWSGGSVFSHAYARELPEGTRFWHAVYRKNDEGQSSFGVGDVLTSPAERRILPPRVRRSLCEDGCIAYRGYDLHAVYVATSPLRALAGSDAVALFEVEPLGSLWSDPESPDRTDRLCTERARIISIDPTMMRAWKN